MAARLIPKWFPWAECPVIVNGPMVHAASATLAAEVSRAGGIGFLPCAADLEPNSAHLVKLDADLTEARQRLGTSSGPLRIGAGFITGHPSIARFAETALPILAKHSPAAVWLFAPTEEAKPHGAIIRALKGLSPAPRVFVQVGNVAAAREALEDGADVLVVQGTDAGGHQFRKGAGVVTLVPEVKTLLEEEAPEREVVVLAAGGISDGRGVAAALALGAEGVVMGTRFTVADESIYPDFRKELILGATDGGQSTLKSEFNDEIVSSPLWGPLYDGRAIKGPLHEKFLSGASLEDVRKSFREDYTPEESEKIVNTWAGAGVGLVKERKAAGHIVQEVRSEAKAIIQKLAGLQ